MNDPIAANLDPHGSSGGRERDTIRVPMEFFDAELGMIPRPCDRTDADEQQNKAVIAVFFRRFDILAPCAQDCTALVVFGTTS